MTEQELQAETVNTKIVDFKERNGNLYLTTQTMPEDPETTPTQSVFIIAGAGVADVTKE